MEVSDYPVRFSVDYPDRDLNRVTHGISHLRGDPDRDRLRRDRRRGGGGAAAPAYGPFAAAGTGLLVHPDRC